MRKKEEKKNDVIQEVTEVQEESYKSGSVQYIDSREVAKMVGKDHDKLRRDIRRYTSQLDAANFGDISAFWMESTYADTYGRTQKCSLVTRKGCEFIAHKLTGEKGTGFTAAYINRFHEMENALTAGSGQGMPGELENRILQFMEKQEEINGMVMETSQAVMGLVKSFSRDGGKAVPAGGVSNPFDPGSGVLKERMDTLNSLVDQTAELCGLERNKLLHYMYQTIQEDMKINLKSYLNVYQSVMNDDSIGSFHLVCSIDRLYGKAVEMNQDVIERKKVYG